MSQHFATSAMREAGRESEGLEVLVPANAILKKLSDSVHKLLWKHNTCGILYNKHVN